MARLQARVPVERLPLAAERAELQAAHRPEALLVKRRVVRRAAEQLPAEQREPRPERQVARLGAPDLAVRAAAREAAAVW